MCPLPVTRVTDIDRKSSILISQVKMDISAKIEPQKNPNDFGIKTKNQK